MLCIDAAAAAAAAAAWDIPSISKLHKLPATKRHETWSVCCVGEKTFGLGNNEIKVYILGFSLNIPAPQYVYTVELECIHYSSPFSGIYT